MGFLESVFDRLVNFNLFLEFEDFFIMKLFFNPLLRVCGLFWFQVLFNGILCFFEGSLFLLFLDFGFEFGHFFLDENILLIKLMKLFVQFLFLFEMGHFLLVLLCSFINSDCLLEFLDFSVLFNQLIFELCEFILIV